MDPHCSNCVIEGSTVLDLLFHLKSYLKSNLLYYSYILLIAPLYFNSLGAF